MLASRCHAGLGLMLAAVLACHPGCVALAADDRPPVLPAADLPVDGADAGVLLLGELDCVACHQAEAAVRQRLIPKPAPLLGQVMNRTRPQFVRQFLLAPRQVKPGTLMPDLLHDRPESERAGTADLLAHFLASLATVPSPDDARTNRLVLEQGRVLYHRTGCVACHAPREAAAAVFPDVAGAPTDADATRYVLTKLDQTSVPLGDLARKYTPSGLAGFLRDPLAARPAGRMPSLSLTEPEANAITAYLRSADSASSNPDVPSAAHPDTDSPRLVDPAKAKRGRERFAALGCAACHELGAQPPRVRSTLKAMPFARLNADASTGCLTSRPGPGIPRFSLSETQRSLVRATLARRAELARPLPPKLGVARSMLALNCYACHARDGYGGPAPSRADYFTVLTGTDLGDEGRLPPHLFEVGNKLRPEWLREVLVTQGKVRPYMATRMPQFGAPNVESLARHFLAADLPANAPDPIGPAGGDAAAGRSLSGTGGYACISCHTFGPYRSLGISVMDMTQMAKRLRFAWYHRYLLDPPSLRPGTRMPAFWPEGKASLPNLLGGDTDRQVRAIWAFLSLGEKAGPPPGLTDEQRSAAPGP